MKDRVSLYPGRVKLTPVSGQENTYDMVRADEPTQEGTPLNKATLLKDATAALFGLSENSVPDDAFVEIDRQLSERLQAVLLWENASPSSDFGEQTLDVDVTGYPLIMIITRTRKIFMIPKTDGISTSFTMFEVYPFRYETHVAQRSITVNDASIVFSGAWKQNNGSQSVVNGYLLPLSIYGIKGGQTA